MGGGGVNVYINKVYDNWAENVPCINKDYLRKTLELGMWETPFWFFGQESQGDNALLLISHPGMWSSMV